MTKDSRLERFLKALCSLDYSDLPTPLSRVEVLWSCLVTGETAPDFQPQSRTEKYLMTILGVYDLEDIPQPISRAEMLLYKLATGDTNVELEGGAKSRYEELLAEIVGKGEIGYTDFYYITHTLTDRLSTLYNTVEAPVKSAILKGQTLNNVATIAPIYTQAGGKASWVYNKLKINFANYLWSGGGLNCGQAIKPNTKYLFYVKLKNECDFQLSVGHRRCWVAGNNYVNAGQTFSERLIITTRSDLSDDYAYHILASQNPASFDGIKSIEVEIMFIEYQEGMENWDIPYFEGMQSVKMPVLKTTGKNLFDLKWFEDKGYLPIDNHVNVKGFYDSNFITRKIKLDSKKQYTFSMKVKNSSGHSMGFLIKYKDGTSSQVLTPGVSVLRNDTSKEILSVGFTFTDAVNMTLSDIQIEESLTATSYEPYKTNILTVNEDVELRGIGDVKDELNALTGELTQRIGEIVFDGSEDENWGLSTTASSHKTTITFTIPLTNGKVHSSCKCDKFKTIPGRINFTDGVESVKVATNVVGICILRSKLEEQNVVGLKTYLQQNPIKIQYQLETEPIKTIDLSTLNQDDKPTKLKTFDDITYVDISSNGLLPELETTVLTKNIEELSTMSLRMNDILDDQERIKDDNDTLNNDLESTMLATTEIYEDIL